MKNGKQGQLFLQLVQDKPLHVPGVDGAGAGAGFGVHPAGAEQIAAL